MGLVFSIMYLCAKAYHFQEKKDSISSHLKRRMIKSISSVFYPAYIKIYTHVHAQLIYFHLSLLGIVCAVDVKTAWLDLSITKPKDN